MKEKEIMEDFKKLVKEQVSNAYKQGMSDGVVIAAHTIYKTLKLMKIEPDNILFTIVTDIAATHGCSDLESFGSELSKAVEDKSFFPKTEIPS